MAFLIKVAIAGKNDEDYKYFDNVFENYVGSLKNVSVKNLTAAILGEKVDAVLYNPEDEANNTYVKEWSSAFGFVRNTLHQFEIIGEEEFPCEFFDAIKQVSPEAIIRYYCITDYCCVSNLFEKDRLFHKICLPAFKSIKRSVDEAIRHLRGSRSNTDYEIWLVQSIEDYPSAGLINSRTKYLWNPEEDYSDRNLRAADDLHATYMQLIGASMPQQKAVVQPSSHKDVVRPSSHKDVVQPSSHKKEQKTENKPRKPKTSSKPSKSKSTFSPGLVLPVVLALIALFLVLLGAFDSDERTSRIKDNDVENVINEFGEWQQLLGSALRLKGTAAGKEVRLDLNIDEDGVAKGTMTIGEGRSRKVEGQLDSIGALTLTEKESDDPDEFYILLDNSKDTITGSFELFLPDEEVVEECLLVES